VQAPLPVLAAGAEEEEVSARLAELERGLGGKLPRGLETRSKELHAPIFVSSTGLAVGVALQFFSRNGQPAPQRFVVSDELQEGVLKSLLAPSRHSEILRAWEYGGMEGAIKAAESQLLKLGAIPWEVREVPAGLPSLLAEIEELSALLEAGAYDQSFAARLAQKGYDLFV
jgi:hypothetical protein